MLHRTRSGKSKSVQCSVLTSARLNAEVTRPSILSDALGKPHHAPRPNSLNRLKIAVQRLQATEDRLRRCEPNCGLCRCCTGALPCSWRTPSSFCRAFPTRSSQPCPTGSWTRSGLGHLVRPAAASAEPRPGFLKPSNFWLSLSPLLVRRVVGVRCQRWLLVQCASKNGGYWIREPTTVGVVVQTSLDSPQPHG